MTRRGLFGRRRCTNNECAPTIEEYNAKQKEISEKERNQAEEMVNVIKMEVDIYTDMRHPYFVRLSHYEHAKSTLKWAQDLYFVPKEYELPKFKL